MNSDFLSSYSKLIAHHPEDIEIKTTSINEEYSQIIIYANKEDLGKLIGKQGTMINALKTIINGCKAKDNISYKIEVRENIK